MKLSDMDRNNKFLNLDTYGGCDFIGDTGYKEEYVLLPLGKYIKEQLAIGRVMGDITSEEVEQFKIVNYYKNKKLFD